MDGSTALKWGLANQLAPEGEALSYSLALAARIARNAPLSVAMSKRIIEESSGWPEAEIWELQRPLVDSILATEDSREGASAFAEKRKPQWRGC
ncbi:carnitinyl-CoA dehydratase [Luminiphilus syltensis NOR5-1B]|uniref:Carnitinyl-CoA dehydratase n=2 Tax=Luminiphilus TaxID=1341118 RepID=B8KUH3_9GAMM|nr:carnitinyl-CoA dehydratase [Luminiphilus syltensis NOR5-1B]